MESTLSVIRAVYTLGGRLRLEDDGHLLMEAPQPLPEAVRRAVREHKPSIMIALGAPLNGVIASVVQELRPYLPELLQRLSDEKLLALINWSIIVAWRKALGAFPWDDGVGRGG